MILGSKIVSGAETIRWIAAPCRQLEITLNGTVSLCCLVIEEIAKPCLSTNVMRPASLEYSRGSRNFTVLGNVSPAVCGDTR